MKIDPKGIRQLKVFEKFFYRAYLGVIFPEIRLCGKWLHDSGFSCGKVVTVTHENNKITITIDENPIEGQDRNGRDG